MEYLDQSPCSVQAAEQSESRLARAGFVHIKEDEPFELCAGGRYYLVRNDSAVIAFVLGAKDVTTNGFNIVGAHLDSPSLKLKAETLKQDRGLWRIGTEVYGGPIVNTWIDRELGIAGKIVIRNGNPHNPILRSLPIHIRKPVALIPNAAIHLNRDINSGFEYNKQVHLQAILGCSTESDNPLAAMILKELDLPDAVIPELDLYLYDLQTATLTGMNSEFICSGRLDNLAMSHAILTAIANVANPTSTAVAVLYDNEEIGSETMQGAKGNFLASVLERIALSQNLSREEYMMSLCKSFMISADMAHAFHPAFAEKYDPDYAPRMNQGPVIKINGNQRYATTAESAITFSRLCEESGVKYQKFMTRSDMPCGSTIGPGISTALGIKTVDVGNPMWAMHSVRETCGTSDHSDMIRVLTHFYQ